MEPELKKFHVKYLEKADECNPRNAMLPDGKPKGFIECLEFGWVKVETHPFGKFEFYSLTEAGSLVLHAPKKGPAKRSLPRLKELPARIPVLPNSLKSLSQK